MKRVFNEEQVKFIQDNYMDMTYREMSNLPLFNGISSKQLRNKARSLGLRKNRQFNHRLFSNIDSKEKAYFVGLLTADGYATDREVGMELNEKDAYILQKLNECIGGVHNVKFRRRNIKYNGYKWTSSTAQLRVYSQEMASDLNALRVSTPWDEDFCPDIPNALMWHAIRGFMDGDGCIYKHHKQGYNMIHFTNKDYNMLHWINEWIKEQAGIEGKLYKEKESKYRLMYYRRDDALKLLPLIYKNSEGIRLERKYDKYLN